VVDQQGQIIDGWHRQRACDELGLFCPREIRHFESDSERLEVAITLNISRRHLNRTQRRELIAVYLKADPAINDNHLGEVIGVSKNTVASVRDELESTCQIDKLPMRQGRDGKDRPAKYRRIMASTPNETEKALAAINDLPASNKILDVTTASRCARRHAKKQEIATRIITPLADDAIRLYHCRFQVLEQVAGIIPGSVHLFCTDIPYGRDFLPEIAALAALAKRMLIPGGLLVTYSGQYYLPEVMRALDEHLTYRWMMASTWDGDAAMIHPIDLTSKWKPILVFSKGKWQKRGRWCDLLHCDFKQKEWHPWQQPLPDVEMLVRYFSEPGDLVVDPCGGGFTTAVACRNLGRRCIACDVDEQSVALGLERLAVTPFAGVIPDG
jgi:site-specific DNA-methyltransferase (adenine-specific)